MFKWFFFPIPVELHLGNQGNSALNSSAISAKECRHRVKGIHIQVAEVKSHLRLRRTVSNSSTASGVPPPRALLSFLVRFTTGTVSVATEVQAEAQVVVLARRVDCWCELMPVSPVKFPQHYPWQWEILVFGTCQ